LEDAGSASYLNVTIAGFRSSGPDAKDNNVFACGRNLRGSLDCRAIAFFIGDHMVGRKHSNHGVGMFAQKKKSGETDRRRRVAAHWFREHLRLRQLRKLFQNCRTKIVVGDDPELFRRSQRKQACHGLLDHGLLAVEGQQLLGSFLSAQRPEARASATGEDHWIKV
jgi:hypothetical protein